MNSIFPPRENMPAKPALMKAGRPWRQKIKAAANDPEMRDEAQPVEARSGAAAKGVVPGSGKVLW
jgi:hypothetical protein